jgi:excisionase family DNA binding protein
MSNKDNSQGALQREVMSVKEVAAYLGLSESMIRKLIREHKIPFNKVEGRYLFFLPVIQDWLQKNTIQPADGVIASEQQEIKYTADRIWKKAQGEM